MHRAPLHGQVSRPDHAGLAVPEGELELTLELHDDIQADGAVHGACGGGRRVDVPYHRATAWGYQWRGGGKGGLVGLEVGAVSEGRRGAGRKVGEASKGATKVVEYGEGRG